MSNERVAILMTMGGMSWRELGETPPRVLMNIVDFIAQRNGYKKVPKPGLMDVSIPPDQFAQMLAAQNERRG